MGSRNRLSEASLADLLEDWAKHGAAAIERVRQDNPVAYLNVVASLCKSCRIEVSHHDDFADVRSHEEILARLEERAGPRGTLRS
jgi:hypothetical protein